MIGNNKMILNQPTMQEAIQYWLDSKFVKPTSRVSFVTKDGDEFRISLTTAEEIKP